MINILFPPYPDEIFYSWFGRYHKLSGNPSITYTLIDLFNDRYGENINTSYPTNLSFFCSQVPSSFDISSDAIIKNNTYFPFFRPFLPKNITKSIIIGMKDKKTTYAHLNDMMGVNSDNLFDNDIIKICKLCVNNDIENVGEAYIHRTHQIPGYFICDKHHIPLEYINLKQTEYLNFFFVLGDIIDKTQPFKIDNKIFDNLLQLTIDITYLTSMNLKNYELVKIITNYKEKLLFTKYPYSTKSGNIKKTELLHDFLNFYDKAYLEFLDSYINPGTKFNWIYYITKNRVQKTHPIRHLLFIRFLFGGIKEFINFNEKYEPFGKAPWPCLNIQCEHYKKDIISSYKILTSNKDKINSQFKCTKCGFIYTRVGPEIDINDRYIIKTVKEYGHIVEKELTDLIINNNYSIATLARRQKCTCRKIISYARIHNLLHYLAVNDQIKIQSTPANNLLDKYKNTVVQYINNNTTATRTEISSALPKECRLIRTNDNDWYKRILPTPLRRFNSIGDLVDWHKRDLELSYKAKEAIDELKKTTDFRITKKRIAQTINAHCIRNLRYLLKLPITKKFIDDSFESNDEYLKRKCDYIIKYLFSKGQTITAKQLRGKLKITIKHDGDLNNYMIESLSRYTI